MRTSFSSTILSWEASEGGGSERAGDRASESESEREKERETE
jgi:hypothetical protein